MADAQCDVSLSVFTAVVRIWVVFLFMTYEHQRKAAMYHYLFLLMWSASGSFFLFMTYVAFEEAIIVAQVLLVEKRPQELKNTELGPLTQNSGH